MIWWRTPIDGGIGGSIAPIAIAPQSGAVKMCARGVERGTNGTPCARVEVKRKRHHTSQNLHHMQTVLHQVQVQKWYLSTTKWLKSTKSKKSLQAIKKLLFSTPSPQGGLSFFFLSFHFSQVDLVFIGRSPLKTENRLVRNVFVRMSLYHARALCARGKSDKMAKD